MPPAAGQPGARGLLRGGRDVRTAVVVFPGTNCEQDVAHALTSLGGDVELVWHRETDLSGFDGVVLPGGFAHGDYLRTGAIARFSPVMAEVERMAAQGLPVLGICNGFQVLCEAGLLPGALIANRDLAFICRFVDVEVVDNETILTRRCADRSAHPDPAQLVRGKLGRPRRHRPDRPPIRRRSQRLTGGGGGRGQRGGERGRRDATSRAGCRRVARLR